MTHIIPCNAFVLRNISTLIRPIIHSVNYKFDIYYYFKPNTLDRHITLDSDIIQMCHSWYFHTWALRHVITKDKETQNSTEECPKAHSSFLAQLQSCGWRRGSLRYRLESNNSQGHAYFGCEKLANGKRFGEHYYCHQIRSRIYELSIGLSGSILKVEVMHNSSATISEMVTYITIAIKQKVMYRLSIVIFTFDIGRF